MTHHNAAVREPIEKLRKGIGKIRLIMERIGAGEGRIGAYAERRRAATKAAAQDVEQHSLAVAERANERLHASALTYPGIRRLAPGDREQRLAHLWKQLDVLVAVDEIGWAA